MALTLLLLVLDSPQAGVPHREAIPDPGAEMMSCGLLTSSKEPGTGAVQGRAGWGAELVPAAAGGGRGRRVQLLPGEFAPRGGGDADPELHLQAAAGAWRGRPPRAADRAAPSVHAPRVGWGERRPGGPAGPPRGAALHPEPKRHAAVAPRHRLLSNCPLTPLSYTAGNLTTAQVSLAQAPSWDWDLELLVYYAEPHKPSAVLAAGLPEPSQSVRGGAGPEPAGEFILLLDRSGSTACPMDGRDLSRQRINSTKETLVLLLKSLPRAVISTSMALGLSSSPSTRQSVENTQQTKAESLQRLQLLQANLGGTEILEPLRAIYRSPCRDGHPCQAVRVYGRGGREHPGHHHRGAASPGDPQQVLLFRHRGREHLIKGIARAVGGSAKFITGQDRTQPKSLKRALQPAVTGISLSWDLPPGMQAELLHWDPEVIFAGQRCLVYAQLRRQPQPPDIPMGGITLQYRIQDQTYKETLQFSLQPQDGDRLPVHRLAAKSLLLELEGAVGAGSEGDWHRALEASLSLGVVCSLTAYVGVDMERGQLVQGLLVRRDVPLAEWAPEESPLLRLVSLQNANVLWNLDPRLAAVLGDVTPSIWATVLAMVWLHGWAVG
ncbi:unnamed protein product [Natator depressus]